MKGFAPKPKDVLAEARSADTPAERLEAIAKKATDREVLLALGKNPSLPIATLMRLAVIVPEAVLDNPKLALLAMGGPAELETWPLDAAIALVARGGAPFELVSWASSTRSGPELRFAAYIATPPKKRESRPVQSAPSLVKVARVLSRGSPLPESAAAIYDPLFLANYAHAPSASLAQIRSEALRDDRTELLEALARHPNAPEALLLRCLGAAPRSDAELLDRLLSHPNMSEAKVLALAGSTPNEAPGKQPEILRAAIRVALARASFPAAERAALPRSPFAFARAALAQSSQATTDELRELAGDADLRVRRAVAGNPRTPPPVLEALARDPEATVVERAAANPELSRAARAACLAHERRRVRRAAAAGFAPADIPDSLADEPDIRTRLVIAERRDAPAATLARLAADASPTVRRALAKNPAATPEVLALLARDGSERVRDGLAKRRTKTAPA